MASRKGNGVHKSSLMKAELFAQHFGGWRGPGAEPVSVLEVGSKSYSAQDTFKQVFGTGRYAYKGLDVEAGPNVDIVPANG